MYFVYGNRRIQRIVPRSLFYPHAVAPGVVEVPDDGSASGRQFGAERKRVSLLRAVTLMPRLNETLLARTRPGSGKEAFPNAAIAPCAQRMALAVPLVEVTNDADPLRVGRPDGELNSGHSLHRRGMRAQLLLQATMSPLLETVCLRPTGDADSRTELRAALAFARRLSSGPRRPRGPASHSGSASRAVHLQFLAFCFQRCLVHK